MKKPLSKPSNRSPEIIPPSVLSAYLVFFLAVFFLLPLSLARGSPKFARGVFFLFYPANLIIFLLLIRRNSERIARSRYYRQKLEEKINILRDEIAKQKNNFFSLHERVARFNNLRCTVEDINRNFEKNYIIERIITIAHGQVAGNKGTCIFYIIGSDLNLQVFKTKKEEKNLVIKAEEGDAFDFWVLRRSNALFVEDAARDFRFDLQKIKEQDGRPVMSLISAPVTSEHRFLGILRLDYPLAGFFTQADLRFLVTIADLGAVALENSELFSRVQDLAIRDSLTALYTKGYLLKALTDECDRARLHNEAFSLLMIDIDFFKNYNDKFGHAAGDIVLKRLSAIICESLKGKNAIASRFGGEEFCVILPGIYKTQAFALASSLRQRVENERILLRRQDTGVTLSIGIAAFPEDAQGQTELLYKADQAMYAAKQEGRNRVCSA